MPPAPKVIGPIGAIFINAPVSNGHYGGSFGFCEFYKCVIPKKRRKSATEMFFDHRRKLRK